jgi:hypothetical protein
MAAAPKLRFTFREYLLVDESSQAKHEYLDGMILGMAGGTPDHTERLEQYRRIATLRHAVLVAHDAVRIDVFSRAAEADGWSVRSFGPGDQPPLPPLGARSMST